MKAWTQVAAGDINAANQRLWVAIGNNAEEIATRINTDSEFVAKIARFMVNDIYDPSKSQKLPREVMGKNFFGIEEAVKHFGVNPTKQQLALLSDVPFSEEVLRASKDTHVLVAVFPLSVLDIRGYIRKHSDQTLFYSQDWFNKQSFAKDKGKVGWQLVRKIPVKGSMFKTWKKQRTFLSNDEETPTARIVVYTTIGHFLASEERLFEKVYVRTFSLDSDGDRVIVGNFGPQGLRAYCSGADDHCDNELGLSIAKKQ